MAPNRIQAQAHFNLDVQIRLEDAADDGQIMDEQRWLTSRDADFLADAFEDQMTVDEAAQALIDTRQDETAEAARQQYGSGMVEDESYRSAMVDAGRSRLLR